MTTGEEDSFEIDGEKNRDGNKLQVFGIGNRKRGKVWYIYIYMEIKRSVAIGKTAMNGMEKIWKDKHVSLDTKKKIGEGPDHTNSNIWQWDMDNDQENGKEDQRVWNVDMEEDAENIMDGEMN